MTVLFRLLATLLFLISVSPFAAAEPVDSRFTYQGYLEQSGEPAQGPFDFEILLYDVESNGAPLGTNLVDDVVVTDGVFTVLLDFGLSHFDGDRLWLETRVRSGGSVGGYTGLLPRVPLTSTPFALHARTVAADSVTGAEIVNGSVDSAELSSGAVGSGQIDPAQVQRRISTSCVAGSSIRVVNQDGSVVCHPDSDTVYSAGDGLSLSDTVFNIDFTDVQSRITQSCAEGEYLTAINQDGSVVCETLVDSLDYNRDPLVLAGVSTHSTPANGGAFYSFVQYPRHFSANPIVVAEVDKSLSIDVTQFPPSGVKGVRTRRETRSRVGFRLDDQAEAVHWFAIDPGSHIIDGKAVKAGKHVLEEPRVEYDQPFESRPVIFLTVDETETDDGIFSIFVSRNPPDADEFFFDFGLSAPMPDGVNWIAMEPGDYSHGRYVWRAGTLTSANCPNELNVCTHTFSPPLPGVPTVILQLSEEDTLATITDPWTRITNLTDTELEYQVSDPDGVVYYLAVVELY